MKKLLSLTCAVVCSALFALTGCSGGDSFTEKSYSSDGVIESVCVDVCDRQIEIGVSDDERVHIGYFDGEKEFLNIAVTENTLFVKLNYNKGWTDYIGAKPSAEYRNVTVKLPLSIKNITISTTNENVKLQRLNAAESICIANNGGNIEFEKIGVGSALELSAKNGNIEGSVTGGWDDFAIECAVKKGNSNLPAEKVGGEKLLKADCNNGNINIEFVR